MNLVKYYYYLCRALLNVEACRRGAPGTGHFCPDCHSGLRLRRAHFCPNSNLGVWGFWTKICPDSHLASSPIIPGPVKAHVQFKIIRDCVIGYSKCYFPRCVFCTLVKMPRS